MKEPMYLPAVDGAALTELFCRLVAIDNPSYGERQMADTVTTHLRALGLDVIEDGAAKRVGGNAGNLYAYAPGVGALADAVPIAFCAHLDSVSPAVGKHAVVGADGRITSTGDTVLGADDLSAVAAMLEAFRLLRQSGVAHRPLELIFTVCEEPYTLGSRMLSESEIPLRAKDVFVPDLTGRVGTAALAAPTIVALTVTVHGRASHAGFAPEKGIHAIAVAARALAALSLGHVDPETTVGFGTIEGGTVPNAVPAQCVLRGEIRGYSDARVWEEADKIRATFEREAALAGATVEVQTERRTRAYTHGEDSSVVQLFRRGCEAAGVPCELTRTFGGSDANTFAERGCRALVIANAMEKIHSVEEYTEVEQMQQLCRLLMALATICDDA